MDLEPPAVQRASGGANLLRGDWREEVEEGVKEGKPAETHQAWGCRYRQLVQDCSHLGS